MDYKKYKYNNKYLEVLKFRLYPTKKAKIILDKEFNFYKRYRDALFQEVKDKDELSLIKLTQKDYKQICSDFKRRVKKAKFDFTKFYSENHFDYAKENVVKSLLYKRKKNCKRYPVDRITIKINDSSCYIMHSNLFFKDGIKIKIRPKIEVLEKVSFINITRTNGKYFMSVARQLDTINIKKTGKACGIDIGFKSYATIFDTDENVTSIEFDNKTINRLISKASYYKSVILNIEKKNKNYLKSKNYRKVLRKLENTYERISTIRANFFNEITTTLVMKYDLITIEHINFESLFKERESKLNLQARSFGVFFKVLEEKAKKYKKKVIRADRFFMSSQICSECGLVNHQMKDFSKREFKCECGYIVDRDVNAARNLMYYGIKILRSNSYKESKGEKSKVYKL